MSPWICRIPLFKTSLYLHKFPDFAYISLVSFSTSTPKISLFDYLVNNHHFSPDCAEKVSLSSSTKYLSKPQNANSVLNFLKETGFSKNQIEAIIQKAPGLLSANLERSIKPKIKVFQDLGFHSSDFALIISASPFVLHRRADSLRKSILGLKNVLGPNVDICSLLKKSGSGCGRVFGYDWNRGLVPNIEYLKSCGVCPLQIATFVSRFPLKYAVEQEKFKVIVKRVEEMGVDRKSTIFIEAVRVMCSLSRESWELKLKLFRDLGFSEQDIRNAFRKSPKAFAASERKIKEATQLLLNVVDISYIASDPLVLSFSVEKRLRPRLGVLKVLESKNLLNEKPGLARFLRMSDAEFVNTYVSPYANEVGGLFICS